ncbi:MAG TPA: hypothetical protein VGC96_08290 [Candidatus Elarobacter sp.]|jgi:hypothetical protein
MVGAAQLVAAFGVAVLALGDASAPTVAPPSPIASALPEIGRTKATRLPCAVIRDLVAPSLGAALDASAAFDAAKGDLRRYAAIPGARRPNQAAQTLVLMALDRKKSAIAKDVLTINAALGDTRVARNQKDPSTRELRDALQALYDAENTKLNALSGFVESQRLSQLLDQDESMSQLGQATGTSARPDSARALPTPQPFNRPSATAAAAKSRQNPDAYAAATEIAVSPEDAVTSAAGADTIEGKEAAAAAAIVKVAKTCR